MRTKRLVTVALVVLAFSPATVATAATKNWIAGSGNWNTAGNWSLAGVPGGGDDVNIKPTDGVSRTITYDYPGPPVSLNSLGVNLNGGVGSATTTFSMSANNLTTGELDVGWSGFGGSGGSGTFTQSGGVTTINGPGLYVGVNATDTGTYDLSGSGALASSFQVIGSSGTGIFTQTGGSNAITGAGNNLVLGYFAGSTGTYTISGGTLSVGNDLYVGNSGTGTLNHSAGTNTINASPTGNFYIGYNSGSTGTYNLSGAGALVSNEAEYIGYSGDGYFNQTGGSHYILGAGNNLYLGYSANSAGIYMLDGGDLYVENDVIVGSSGTGSLWIRNDASVFVLNNLLINNFSVVNLDGGTLRFNAISGLNRVNYFSGTFQLAGYRNMLTDSTITTLYGANPTIPAGKGLNIEGGANIGDEDTFQTVTVNGGSLSVNEVNGQFNVLSAYLEITNGGQVSSNFSTIANFVSNYGGQVLVSGTGSTWNVGNELTVGGSSYGALDIREGALVHIATTLNIFDKGVVNLNGGTIRFDGYYRETSLANDGVFNFHSGTVQLAGNRSIGSDADITDIFGGAPTLTPGKGLTVEGTATLQTTVTLDGGTFTANALAGGSYLQLYRGTLNLMNQAVTIGSGGPLGSALDVNEDMAVNVTLGITNQGLVTGDGQIGGTFANAATGELRAQAGRSLRLTGANNTNAGQIKLFGGELEFTQNLTSSAGGFISGNGSLIVGGGLVNQGTMNFAGTANIDGAVTNAVGGKIISGGGGATIFYDDVMNNGEIRTSTNGFTVFFGSVSGAGTFTGTGTVNFEGDLNPGNSPASISFGGNVVFGPESTLVIEIGGVTPGSQYDQVNVAGTLTLDGTLQISLINGFTPALGDQFNLFSFTSSSGDFANYEGLAVGGHLELNGSLGPGGLQLTARPAVDGDINLDGTVDIFDVNSVSANWGTAGPQGDANGDGIVDIFDVNLISANWGATGGAAAAVPEPATFVLGLLGAMLSGLRLARRIRVPTRG